MLVEKIDDNQKSISKLKNKSRDIFVIALFVIVLGGLGVGGYLLVGGEKKQTQEGKSTKKIEYASKWKEFDSLVIPLDEKEIKGLMLPGEKTKNLIPSSYSLGQDKSGANYFAKQYRKTVGEKIYILDINEGMMTETKGSVINFYNVIDGLKNNSDYGVAYFDYLGKPGAIAAKYNGKLAEEPTNFCLYYDHNGVLLTIRSTDGENFRPEKLIEILKTLGK